MLYYAFLLIIWSWLKLLAGWLSSVVIWQVTDKSKQSASYGFVHGGKISWEPLGRHPPTSPYKHSQDCPLLVSIHFFNYIIVWSREGFVQFVFGFRCCILWHLLLKKQTATWQKRRENDERVWNCNKVVRVSLQDRNIAILRYYCHFNSWPFN